MKFIATSLIAVLALASIEAHAAEKPNVVRVTNEQALNVLAGLSTIGSDGYKKIIKDGGAEKEVTASWVFSANVRRVIARDLIVTKAAAETFFDIKRKLIKQYLGTTIIPREGSDEYFKLTAKPEWAQLEDELKKLSKAPIDEDLRTLSEDDLKIETNEAIQGGVLAQLDSIIEKK